MPLGQLSAAEPLHQSQTRDAAFLGQRSSLVTEAAPELDVAQLNPLADADHPTKASLPRHFSAFYCQNGAHTAPG